VRSECSSAELAADYGSHPVTSGLQIQFGGGQPWSSRIDVVRYVSFHSACVRARFSRRRVIA
jgi:hypothetical protein